MSERTQRKVMEESDAPRLGSPVSINLTGRPLASRSPIPHPEEWPVVRLANITLKVGSGATPRGGSENYLPERVNFALIRSQNVFDRYFDCAGLAFISDEQAQGLQNVSVQPDDLLLNITGDGITFARCCAVPEDVLPACVNQHVSIVRVDPSLAYPGYVLSFLTHPSVKAYIESFNAGGSRRAITKGHIESFRLPLPPLSEQHKIAAILGTLDDKIELNRRMNETLEAMARALFQSWFVDFDPVRAKAAVRREHPRWTDAEVCRAALPTLAPEIAALFPDSFENSALGDIPKGWRIGQFSDVAENSRRGISPGDIPELTPYIALEHMPRKCIALSEWGIADGVESGKFAFNANDILFGKLRPYFHKVGVAPIDGVCSTDILVLSPRAPEWFGFVLSHASSDAFVEHANAGSTGTKMPRTNWTDMARYPVILPPETLAKAYTAKTTPAISRIIASIHQNHSLAALRDTLLPKLISGELRVKDAERIAEVEL